MNQDPVRQMKTCSGNNINFETENCALKKIRGELYKMKGGNHSAFFQDCDVAKWDPEQIAANKTAAKPLALFKDATDDAAKETQITPQPKKLQLRRSQHRHPVPFH